MTVSTIQVNYGFVTVPESEIREVWLFTFSSVLAGVVKGHVDRKHITVELMDKQEVTASVDDVFVVGGATPCPLLAISDCVLARVRTKNGPHPSAADESCDCYIPGMVCSLPEDKRKGLAARYSILTFSGKGITCARNGLIKISETKYREISDFIKENGVVQPSTARSEGRDEQLQHRSELSFTNRSVIHIPCVDKESPHPSPRPSPHPSPDHLPHPSPHHVPPHGASAHPPHESSADKKTHSHSRSRTSSSVSQSSSKISQAARSESGSNLRGSPVRTGSSPSPRPQGSEEVGPLLEQQRLQGEQLELQRRELSDMLTRQRQLEAEIEAYREAGKTTPPHDPTHQEVVAIHRDEKDSPDFFQKQEEGSPVAEGVASADMEAGSQSHDGIAGQLSQTGSKAELEEAELARPVTCEQAVNTDAWTQERGVVTEPIMTSQAVGTECDPTELEPNLATPQETPHRDAVTPTSEPDLGMPHDTPRRAADKESRLEPEPDLEAPRSGTPSECSEMVPTPVPTLPPSPCPSPLPTPSLTPTRRRSLAPSPAPNETTPTASFMAHHYPPDEEDPLVNQHVLARWPDDGWYYRALVVRPVGQLWYQVQDASQDVETIHALDIIIDLQDAQKPVLVGDTITGLHPKYDYSYAPGKVTGMAADGFHFSVEFYDGTEGFLPRQDIYHLARAKHQQDMEYLRTREQAWVGQAVVARRDRDGLYVPGKFQKSHVHLDCIIGGLSENFEMSLLSTCYPHDVHMLFTCCPHATGEVMEQVRGTCCYLIKWADETTQVQEIVHMFGKLTKKRGLRLGDNVLALALPSTLNKNNNSQGL